MPWVPLGSLAISTDWASFPTDVIGAETLRVTQAWNGQTIGGWFLIAQYFPTTVGARGLVRRLKLGDEPRVIQLPIPQEFKDQNILTYTLQLKQGVWAAGAGLPSWTAQIEAFY